MFNFICKVWHKLMVGMFATKLITNFHFMSHQSKMQHGCIEYLVGGSRRLCLLSCSTHSKSHSKMKIYRCKMFVVPPEWAMMHWFWDLVNLSTKPPLQLPHWPHLLKQLFSQKYHDQNLLYLNLHVWHLDTTQNHLNHYLSKWQRELRHLKDLHLENCRSQDRPFLNAGANRIWWSAQPTISNIADFLTTYLLSKI